MGYFYGVAGFADKYFLARFFCVGDGILCAALPFWGNKRKQNITQLHYLLVSGVVRFCVFVFFATPGQIRQKLNSLHAVSFRRLDRPSVNPTASAGNYNAFARQRINGFGYCLPVGSGSGTANCNFHTNPLNVIYYCITEKQKGQ